MGILYLYSKAQYKNGGCTMGRTNYTDPNRKKMCMNCKHQYIVETEHEWIECFCKVDNHKQSPFRMCDNWEEHIPKGKSDE